MDGNKRRPAALPGPTRSNQQQQTRPGTPPALRDQGRNRMPLPASLANSLELPVVGSPLFIVSGPELVIAQCKAATVGSFPALKPRPVEKLAEGRTRSGNELRDS